MSDAIKTRLIIKVYAHCILHEAALQISQQAGKKHRSIDLKTKPCKCTKTKTKTTHTCTLPFVVKICNDQHIMWLCVLQGGRFQWVTQLRPGWLSKFMPTVSYMRPPFKYHSKLAKSIASIDLKTKPCKCTKTKTTHTCTLPFVVKICNDQHIMWLCVLQGGRFQWAMQLRPGWLSKFMPTVSYMRPPFKYHSKLAKSIASLI